MRNNPFGTMDPTLIMENITFIMLFEFTIFLAETFPSLAGINVMFKIGPAMMT